MGKEILRSELLRSLSLLNPDEIQSLSFGLTKQIIKLFQKFPELISQIGAGYLPLKAEIAPVYQELLRTVPVSIAYPILVEENMSFAIPQGMPKGKTWLLPPYHEVRPKWLMVPGVGFDLGGARLGRGKGYYDRYLEKSSALKIGLAWTGQLKEKIPVDDHDCHMDYIITESFCWDVKQQIKF